jgi:hypothetical protein
LIFKFKILILFSSILLSGCGSEFEILLDKNGIPPVIYWSELSGTINSINPDRSMEKTIITTSDTPLDVDVDTSNNKIYWAEFTGSVYRIKSAGIDGSGETVIYTSTETGPTSIAIDRSNSKIFWNEYNTTNSHNNIYNSSISSGSLSSNLFINNIGVDYTYSICIDSRYRKIYFSANSYYDNGTTLGSNNTGGRYKYELDIVNTSLQNVSGVGASTPSVPFKGFAVDEDEGYVYYSLHSNDVPLCVRKRDLMLNNPETWIPASGFDIQKIALDLKHRKIYWTSESDNRIYRADLDLQNSNVEVFLDLASKPTGISIPH